MHITHGAGTGEEKGQDENEGRGGGKKERPPGGPQATEFSYSLEIPRKPTHSDLFLPRIALSSGSSTAT